MPSLNMASPFSGCQALSAGCQAGLITHSHSLAGPFQPLSGWPNHSCAPHFLLSGQPNHSCAPHFHSSPCQAGLNTPVFPISCYQGGLITPVFPISCYQAGLITPVLPISCYQAGLITPVLCPCSKPHSNWQRKEDCIILKFFCWIDLSKKYYSLTVIKNLPRSLL